MEEITAAYVRRLLPRRDPMGHKGTFGKVLCVCGSVGFSGAAVFVYQGAITLLATLAGNVLTDTIISYLSASGGVLIIGIGITIAGIKKINTVNLLPGIFLAAAFGGILQLF